MVRSPSRTPARSGADDSPPDEMGGAESIGLVGFADGGNLRRPGRTRARRGPGAKEVDFAVLGYAITSMETETYRPGTPDLLGDDAAPELRRATLPGGPGDKLVAARSSSGHTARGAIRPTRHQTYRLAEDLPPKASAVPLRPPCSATAPTASPWRRATRDAPTGPRSQLHGSPNNRGEQVSQNTPVKTYGDVRNRRAKCSHAVEYAYRTTRRPPMGPRWCALPATSWKPTTTRDTRDHRCRRPRQSGITFDTGGRRLERDDDANTIAEMARARRDRLQRCAGVGEVDLLGFRSADTGQEDSRSCAPSTRPQGGASIFGYAGSERHARLEAGVIRSGRAARDVAGNTSAVSSPTPRRAKSGGDRRLPDSGVRGCARADRDARKRPDGRPGGAVRRV